MEKKQNVPELRFQNKDEWSPESFENLISRVSITDNSPELPRVEYEDIISGTGVLNKDVYKKSSLKVGIKFSEGDVLYGKLRPYLKNWLFATFPGIAVGDFWVLHPEKVAGEFLYYLIQSTNYQNLANMTTGTKMPRADWAVMSKARFIVPNDLTEQKRIGKFLANLDKNIFVCGEKIQKLQQFRQAMLTKLFPREGAAEPELRFRGFSGKWTKRSLKEISMKSSKRNADRQYTETFTNSAEFGVISQRDFFDHDISNAENTGNYYVVENDDFVYNPRISTTAPVGPINRNRLGRTGIMSPLYMVFKTHDVDRTYLEWFFKTTVWHSFMRLNGDTGARADRFSIKEDLFFEMPIPCPSLEEQKRIGKFFDQLDSYIALQQKKLERMQRLKAALLEKMFV